MYRLQLLRLRCKIFVHKSEKQKGIYSLQDKEKQFSKYADSNALVLTGFTHIAE